MEYEKFHYRSLRKVLGAYYARRLYLILGLAVPAEFVTSRSVEGQDYADL